MSTQQLKQDYLPIVPENLLHNTQNVAFVRNMTAPILGLVAGVLGLTGFTGFALFLAGSIAVSLCIYALRMPEVADAKTISRHGRATRYLGDPWSLWLGVVSGSGGLPTYLLTWTLFYGLVHVYD
ncbi:Rab5-interacting protein-domain-containing protein [Protomyces lactucae-debilis]|uniref:ER membrane protein complex subunit 6 n=1 Tax=Protomyces lactucae-debilis TaxID=2754530 RepID=A0A1Y2FX20_PROLT|nr:Rab5-interacting protein-domain-containing protein [Protomyces lactucae-debilis]ORY87726.1 Rab5-interacting protein-domain-containing protein [Protomyces lactucae-debilis]